MAKSIITTLLMVVNTGFCVGLLADAAPPVFPGYTLWPFDSKGVSMKSEKVDIYYGDVCRIEAVFEVFNPTRKIVEKKIGFPFNISINKRRNLYVKNTKIKMYDFTLICNGENVRESDIPSGRTMRSDKQYWYGWTCKFKPDRNIVKLTYHTLAGFGNSGYRWERAFHYFLFINPDKNWPERIDSVQVTVHFPYNIDKRQILAETSPPGYEIKERKISWRFTAFTPKPESNIVLHLIDYTFFTKMLEYEKVLSAPASDNATKLKAAFFFASLAPSEGIDKTPPTYFKQSYYATTVLPNLSSAEMAVFDTIFKFKKVSEFESYYTVGDYESFRKNDAIRQMVMDVATRIGYFEKIRYPVIYKYIEGAKKLFNEVVVSEPRNAAAWRAYIDNYYLIETDACSPCIPWIGKECDCPESQKELIRRAFEHCGNDSTIALWYRYLFPARAPLPATIEAALSAKPQERVAIKINSTHPLFSSTMRHLSPEELAIIERAYIMSKKGLFVLKNTHVDDDTQKKLVEILGGCSLYRYAFCRELKKLRSQGK